MTKFIIVHQYIKENKTEEIGLCHLVDYEVITDKLRDIYVNIDEISGFRDGAIELKNGDRIDLLKEKAEEIMEMINDENERI